MEELKPIRTERDHRKALKAIEELIASNPKPRSRALDRLEVLSILVEAYERSRPDHRIDSNEKIDPVAAIKFALERTGKTEKDLERILNCSRSRVWEILNYKRALTLLQIRALASLGIPPARLIPEYGKQGANRSA